MRFHAGISTALAALLLVGTPLVAAATPGPDETGPRRGPGVNGSGDPRSERARAALAAARGLFGAAGGAASEHTGPDGPPVPGDAHGGHASLVLRDLAAVLPALEGEEYDEARALLARPTTNMTTRLSPVKYDGAPSTNTCLTPGNEGLRTCVHWVTDDSDPHAPPNEDGDLDGVPDWVTTSQQALETSWTRIVDSLGYAPPLSDELGKRSGPDGRLDVYLAELGGRFYGYCSPDVTAGGPTRYPAFCVLDNDFAEYSGDPLSDLRVTAAHEFFHAVQLGYTATADAWVMEGTAAWVEDEVFDAVNDNLQYLALSPLAHPHVPLDLAPDPNVHGWEHFGWRYGSWIWWRFLSEYHGTRSAADPSVVRDVWQRLGRGQRSLPALRHAVAARGTSFGEVFGDFGTVNRFARRWYDEGRSYPQAPVSQRLLLTGDRRSSAWRKRTLDHLSTQHVVVRPGRGLSGAWRLRIQLDLPVRARGSRANVVLHRTDRRLVWRDVRLDRYGDARLAVPFDRRTVASVALSLTNASVRMSSCGDPASPFSCRGWSPDDALPFRYRFTAVR